MALHPARWRGYLPHPPALRDPPASASLTPVTNPFIVCSDRRTPGAREAATAKHHLTQHVVAADTGTHCLWRDYTLLDTAL